MNPIVWLAKTFLFLSCVATPQFVLAEGTAEDTLSKNREGLSILVYNAYLKPKLFSTPDMKYRTQRIPSAIQNAMRPFLLKSNWPDVIVIAEGFDEQYAGERSLGPKRTDGYSQCLSNENCQLKRELWLAGYKWISENVGTEGYALQDGGVFIASRFPIVQARKEIFSDFVCSDRFADKGVAYAQINKRGQLVHVFATHLQASYFHPKTKKMRMSCYGSGTVDFESTRKKQMTQMKHFIESLQINRGEPIIVAGDFNVRYESPEYAEMLGYLNAEAPKFASTLPQGRLKTFDSLTNSMKRCVGSAKRPVFDLKYYDSCGKSSYAPDDWLDYVLVFENEVSITRNINTVLRIQTRRGRDLSDHHAVLGEVFWVRN